MDSTKEFTTTDLNCAAALIAYGFEMKRMERAPDNNRAVFVFDNTKDLQALCARYWVRKLPVDSISKVFDAQRFLKNAIHNKQ